MPSILVLVPVLSLVVARTHNLVQYEQMLMQYYCQLQEMILFVNAVEVSEA